MQSKVSIPSGQKITVDKDNKLIVPDNPIIPYIRGDGIGADITPVMLDVVNKAMEKAYGDKKKISFMEIYAGERAFELYGENNYLPDETLAFIKDYRVAIKGPLMTPVGGGMRSLNVTLRQTFDLYVCLRPVRYFQGVPSPVKHPELTDTVIFRENTEDIYSGIEYEPSSIEAQKLIKFLQDEMGVNKIKSTKDVGIGVKPMSKNGTMRLVRAAVNYAILHNRKSITIVHKGNIMKYTEGQFKNWAFSLFKDEFNAKLNDKNQLVIINPNNNSEIICKDVIADAFLQNILLYPSDYDVVCAMNLNGDYISDALAAIVGGIGIAPGANIGDGYAIFEATHGTAPSIANKNIANPGSILLSAVMMLEHLGFNEASCLIVNAIEKAILSKRVTKDFYDLMEGASLVSTKEFGDIVISLL